MKKILFLLLTTVSIYGQTLQNPTFGTVKIKNNTTSATATKVNVQESDGTINTKPLSELANYVEFASAVNLPVTGEQGKLYLTKDNNRLYRFNGTIYQELTTDISGKEDIANKQNSLAVDGSNTKYPTVTAVNTGLALKANLASPTFTGVPLAPTATAGTNTTQIATTAFVTGANAGNVKTTGAQTIVGKKTFNTVSTDRAIDVNNSNTGEGIRILNSAGGYGQTVFNTSIGQGIEIANTSNGIGLHVENQSGGAGIVSKGTTASTGFVFSGRLESSNTFTVDKFGATTATSFIKSSSPTTNILLAGGGDIAQNTAFNKNFGTTAGTVVEGNDSRLSDSRNPLPNSSNYIQNQNASAQSANMWISGEGKFGSSVTSAGDINLFKPAASLSNLNFGYGSITSGKIGMDSFNGIMAIDAGYTGYGGSISLKTDGLQRLGIATSGAATFSSTVTASPATLSTELVTKGQLDAAVGSVIENSYVIDFPSVAANTYAAQTRTLTGVVLGDYLILSATTGLPALNGFYSAHVTSSNTIDIRFNNFSTSAIDPASITIKVRKIN